MSDTGGDQYLREDTAGPGDQDYEGDPWNRLSDDIRDGAAAPPAPDSKNVGTYEYIQQQGDKGGAKRDENTAHDGPGRHCN